MTTREPGASDVFTHGFWRMPELHRLAGERALQPTSTKGFEVFVQLVIAAITTLPSLSSTSRAVLERCRHGAAARLRVRRACLRRARRASSALAPDNGTWSWGRAGPARLGSTVDRSSSSVSENTGSTSDAHSPCSLAYASTRAT